MIDSRPNPEELLARVTEEESESLRGKLKIFLGAAAGVGKTYKMLESAKELLADDVDVIAGCVVTHGRKETEALLAGFEIVPAKEYAYRDTKFYEFDIDAVLKRKPQVVLVDELAHTNTPGARHAKRWQDVEELLEAGISVYTTVNIQHLESANDIVAGITHVTIRETVPNKIFEKANDIELVDLPPDALIQRLKEGKVYVPEKSEFALRNFFRKGNLIALRELALRLTAERVDEQMDKYRIQESIREVWPASERILVCVGPNPMSARVVRAAKRMASGMHADWFAAYVETPAYLKLPQKQRDHLMNTLRLAEQLGAQTTVLTGTNVGEELVTYAQRCNVSKIVIGKPDRPRWREILFGSVVDNLIRLSGSIDVHVITGDSHPDEKIEYRKIARQPQYSNYLGTLAIIILTTTIVKTIFQNFALVNLIMVYQLAIVFIAIRYGRGPSIMASILSVAICDFFFVPPYGSLTVADPQYILTLAVMLIVALTLSTLTYTVKHQAEMARQRERRSAVLYALTREQALAVSTESVLRTSIKHIKEVFDCKVAVCLAEAGGQLTVITGYPDSYEIDSHEYGVAQWVYVNEQLAGAGTATLPGAKAIYFPLLGSKGSVGVLGILVAKKRIFDPEEMHLLETFVNQLALALERARLSEAQQGYCLRAEV